MLSTADPFLRLLAYFTPSAEQTSSSGSSAGFHVIIAIVIGVILTALIWPWLGPKLKQNHERLEELAKDADAGTRASIDFNSPPAFIRNGKMGTVLQFFLILLPITLLAYYLLSKI